MYVSRLVPTIILASVPLANASGHSWYPRECCSDKDCMPANFVSTDDRGNMIIVVGDRRIVVPADFAHRTSHDGQSHICFKVDDADHPTPVCLFVPAGS